MKDSRYLGVIEGFYGQMWTHQDRLHLIRHLREWNLNLYIYGARDDPYHRFHWEKPYPPAEMRQFTELAAEAEKQGVQFSYAISPGNTFDPQSERHLQLLLDKLAPFLAMGCTLVPILYDDLTEPLDPNSAKGERHAESQARLINELERRIRIRWPQATLLFAPTEYMTAEKSRYLVRLHACLSPDILTIVSGVDAGTDPVCPRRFSNEGAERYRDHFKRRPFFWDNFNVRDNALTVLHWSPYAGRGTKLPEICSGIILNPLNIYSLNIPVFGTFGDYLADPEGYDPSASMRRQLRLFLGNEGAPLGEVLAQWFTAEWFAESGSGFRSSENNLPPLPDAQGEWDKVAGEIAARLAPLLDFDERFNRALMPPWIASSLMPYAHLLSDFARALSALCRTVMERGDIVVALDRFDTAMGEIRRHNYRLPESLLLYAAAWRAGLARNHSSKKEK